MVQIIQSEKASMEITTIQPQMFKILLQIALKQTNYKSINVLLRNVFSKPDVVLLQLQMLNDSFKIYSNVVADKFNHNIDLDALKLFYQDIEQNITNLPQGFQTLKSLFFETISNESQLTGYVLNSKQCSKLRVFLILLYSPSFLEGSIFSSDLIKLLKLIKFLSVDQKQCLAHWLTSMDLFMFHSIVTYLQDAIKEQIKKILPDEIQKHDPVLISENLMVICSFLAIFQKSNIIFRKINSDEFKNQDVMKYFRHGDQFNIHLKKSPYLNFILYPFLLDLSYKSKLFQIQNKYQHQLKVQRDLMEMINNGRIAEVQLMATNHSVRKSLYLQVDINRNNILEDSINKLISANLSYKNPLKVKFIGEDGDDAGGVKKEYFQMIIKSLFNEHNDMFIPANNNSCYWFNGLSFEAPIMYEFVGIILGLSIYNNTLLDLKFPRFVYEKLLLEDGLIQDSLQALGEIDIDMQRSFKYILETQECLDSMQLTFEASLTHFDQIINFNLVQYGSHIRVNQTNKQDYVSKYSNWVINQHIKTQFASFKKGFYRVVTGEMIKLFSAEELEKIICGSNQIDFGELRKGARYGAGYLPTTQIIIWFWEILDEFTEDQKKSFLSFTTGSDRIPINGLSNLKFIIERQSCDSQTLPNSRTCSNLLMLPEYSTKEKLKTKLILSLQHKQGFGLI